MTKEERQNSMLRDVTKARLSAVVKICDSLLTAESMNASSERIDENFRALIFELGKSPWADYIIIVFYLFAVYVPPMEELNQDAVIKRLSRIIRRCKNGI